MKKKELNRLKKLAEKNGGNYQRRYDVLTKKSAPQKTKKPASAPTSELTEIKGIGAATADKLNAVGINSVSDLAQADATDLVTKLESKMNALQLQKIPVWIARASSADTPTVIVPN